MTVNRMRSTMRELNAPEWNPRLRCAFEWHGFAHKKKPLELGRSLTDAMLQLRLNALANEVQQHAIELVLDREEIANRVHELEARISRLASYVPRESDRTDDDALREASARVESITRDIFGGSSFTCQEMEDREVTGDRYFAFCVVDRGEVGEILARNDEWHRRLMALSENVRGMFRLSIDVQ